jgi:hypothetical protein
VGRASTGCADSLHRRAGSDLSAHQPRPRCWRPLAYCPTTDVAANSTAQVGQPRLLRDRRADRYRARAGRLGSPPRDHPEAVAVVGWITLRAGGALPRRRVLDRAIPRLGRPHGRPSLMDRVALGPSMGEDRSRDPRPWRQRRVVIAGDMSRLSMTDVAPSLHARPGIAPAMPGDRSLDDDPSQERSLVIGRDMTRLSMCDARGSQDRRLGIDPVKVGDRRTQDSPLQDTRLVIARIKSRHPSS